MPLEAGSSKGVISHNIEEMQAAGHPHNQAVAAALHNADKSSHGSMATHHMHHARDEEHEARKSAREAHQVEKYGRPSPY